MTEQQKDLKRSFLRNKNFIYPIAIVLGLLVGIQWPAYADTFGQLGDMLISLLKLCISPIILTTIVLGAFGIMSGSMRKRGYALISIPISLYILSSAIGIGAGVLSSTSTQGLDLKQSEDLKKVTLEASLIERGWDDPIEVSVVQETQASLSMTNVIPDNIFSALDTDSIIKIIIFAFIFSIALFYSSQKTQESILSIFQSIKESFEKLFSFIASTMPFILFCIVAHSASQLDKESFSVMLSFIGYCGLGFLILFMISTLLISSSTKTSFFKTIASLSDPIVLAIASSMNILTIPSAANAMKEKFGLKDQTTDAVIALGVLVAPYGQALYLSFATVFAASLYDIPLALGDYIYILGASIVMTLSAAGAPAIVFMSFASLIFSPLGIPFGTFYTLMVLMDFIIAPMRTLLAFYPNCALLSLLAKAK